MSPIEFPAPASASLPVVWFGTGGPDSARPSYVCAELVTPGWATANGAVAPSWPQAVERFEQFVTALDPARVKCRRFTVTFGMDIETSEARWWMDVPFTMRVLRALAGAKDRFAVGGGTSFRYLSDGTHHMRVVAGGVGGCTLERAHVLTPRNT